ncbi:DUF998 domain-containing protein [Actinoplanes sp. L3-i22]|uniref:DUF998 domain-containing protein n=1 Tax=Actinoplanes sp. L3-i22 TaxID=2836373 RepID=UPI001C78C195|nr:DUF998 domain-containing protein [Actinoplanes sp. L3-i22]BCY09589.1 hypothetical protein L3i22_046770 [Actinoplanes sp. L3-i22]
MRRLSSTLLTAGVAAGPLYVVVSLTEVAVRDGFDPTRHAWSMLANGTYGWIHSLNLFVSGVLVIAGAIAIHQAIRQRPAPTLLALYGLGMVGAAFFTADPGRGFPVGTPEVVPVSGHGIAHFAVGGVGFLGLVAGCLLLARRLGADGQRGLAMFSRVTGVFFLVAFLALAGTGGPAWALLAFTAAVILASAWLSTIFTHYRRVAARPGRRSDRHDPVAA